MEIVIPDSGKWKWLHPGNGIPLNHQNVRESSKNKELSCRSTSSFHAFKSIKCVWEFNFIMWPPAPQSHLISRFLLLSSTHLSSCSKLLRIISAWNNASRLPIAQPSYPGNDCPTNAKTIKRFDQQNQVVAAPGRPPKNFISNIISVVSSLSKNYLFHFICVEFK